MGCSPVIYSGTRSKVLSQKGFVLRDGTVIDNDGPINYIKNGYTEVNAVGWNTYLGGTTSPTNGTGGTPSHLSVQRNTTSPLRGSASLLLTNTGISSAQGEGFSYDFTIDNSDKGKVLQCSFEYQIASGVFADDGLSVWIYDITNAVLIQPAPYLIKNSGIIEKFAVEFQTAINSTSYRLIVHCGSTASAAYSMKFDNFVLGPQAKLYGSAVTDWLTYTPTVSGLGTGTCTATGVYRFVGGSMEISVELAFGGTGSGSSQVQFSIPAGYTINGSTDKAGILAVGTSFGLTGSNQYNPITAEQFSANTFAFEKSGTNLFWLGSEISAGKSIHVKGMFPVNGKSASQVMSSDADTRVVAAVYNGTPTGTLAASNNLMTFPTKVQDTHAQYSSGLYTIPVSGYYRCKARSVVGGTIVSGTSFYQISVARNGSAVTASLKYASGTIEIEQEIDDLIYFDAGQTASFLSNTNVTSPTFSSTIRNYMSIERISGPSQVAASESVGALYTGAPPTGSLSGSLSNVTFGTKVKDSHNAMSGATYTVPVSGTYSISATVAIIGTRVLGSTDQINILVNGSTVASNIQNAGGAIGTQYPSVTLLSYPMLAGQTVTAQVATSATTPSYDSTASRAYFSIIRTGNY